MDDIAIETGGAPVVEDFTPEPMAAPEVAAVSQEVAAQKVSALAKTLDGDLSVVFDAAIAKLDALKSTLESTLARYRADAHAIIEDATRDMQGVKSRIDDLREKARRARSGEV